MTEYWWDRSGRDADLERLEELLGRLSLRGAAPPSLARAGRRAGRVVGLGIAAVVVLSGLIATGYWFSRSTAWRVVALAGRPTVEGSSVVPATRLQPGQSLETGVQDRAKLLVGRIGEIDLEPGSRLRLVDADRHRLALDHGTLRAFIWAPPRRFSVETREAVAVDLGCAYSLTVGPAGDGLLRVSFGWVSFETAEREVYVPAGAMCMLHAGKGPGTPHFEDAPEGFREALRTIDEGGAGPETLELLASSARARDAFTLLQALDRLDWPKRERLYDRLTALVPPPPGLDRNAVLRGDARARSAFWAILGLGEMKWWQLSGDHDRPGPTRGE